MDSLTQVALGASVGQVLGGRAFGRLAPIWGGVCGLLPDLDLLIPQQDPVRAFTYHRSASHSLFVLAALAPLVAWAITRLHAGTRERWLRWFLLVLLAFVTHVLLDCCTVYGTQIFWPIDPTPVAWSTIFIIDPLYSLPLAIGVAAALLRPMPRHVTGHRWNTIGLVLSTTYLLWSAGAKLWVDHAARESIARQGIAAERVLTTPAPLQTFLWRVLVMEDGGYREGFYSLIDGSDTIRFERHDSSTELLAGIEEQWSVRRLQWFTKGYYSVEREHDAVVMTDLRMGVEPDYVFRFEVGAAGNPHTLPVPVRRLPRAAGWRRLPWLWRRIWDANA